jgi:hypothetical protein
MSIYDEQCDMARMIPGERCTAPATHWGGLGFDSASCERHAVSFASPIGSRTWAEVRTEYERANNQVALVIAEAERTGQFIECDDNWHPSYYTAQSARQHIKMGYSMVKVSLVKPDSIISELEREAEDTAEELKLLRSRIRSLKQAAKGLSSTRG